MNRLLATGLVGSAITAICCFTPVLVSALGLIGMGVITGYLDYVLLPGLAVFLGLTLYGWVRRKQWGAPACCAMGAKDERP